MRLTSRILSRALLGVWLGLFAAIAFPWGDFQNHTHWYKVSWIPFVSPPLKPADIASNIVAFIPLGTLVVHAWDWRGRRVWPIAIALSTLLATAAECAQLYSHRRFPSATDVTANTIGTAVGIWWGTRMKKEGRRKKEEMKRDVV